MFSERLALSESKDTVDETASHDSSASQLSSVHGKQIFVAAPTTTIKKLSNLFGKSSKTWTWTWPNNNAKESNSKPNISIPVTQLATATINNPRHIAISEGNMPPSPSSSLASVITQESMDEVDQNLIHVLKRRSSKRSIAALLKLQFPNLQTIGGLKPMFRVTHLFLNKIPVGDGGVRIDHPKGYDVVNELGEVVYQANVQREKCLGLCQVCPHRFTAVLTDIQGEEVLNMEGDPGFCGRRACVKVRGRLEKHGSVVQEGDCCTPDYSLCNTTGQQLLKVRPAESVNCFNLCIPIEYGIFHGDYTSQVGKVSTKWQLASAEELPQYFAQHKNQRKRRLSWGAKKDENVMQMIGATFPHDMPIQHKVLVLATLFLVKIFHT